MRDEGAGGQLAAAWEVVLHTLGSPPSDMSCREVVPRGDSTLQGVRQKLPVTVFTGFLGAGKTTLLCRLLEQTSLRVTALVNDFASINVDAGLIRSRNADTIEFQNGCACCALQTDLHATLEEIGSRESPPDAVVIEASGVADPMGIAQTVANVTGTALDGIVTLVDGATVSSRSLDPSTASIFIRQIAAAHLIVMTKEGSLTGPLKMIETIADLAPGRPILLCEDLFVGGGESACEILLGAAFRGARPAIAAEIRAHTGFAVETLDWSTPLPESSFFELLDRIPEALYRMKGFVWLSGQPEAVSRCVQVQVVGQRWRVTDAETESQGSHLVLIGRADEPSFCEYVSACERLQH